ncbi:YlxM family DNA-binding protein [Cohnella sp. 56]|uniref:YlxM family DNA-binding protein n=1 Tax=Cohnella sp. 56 TaxID=3113722 RepID=UPI0030E7BC46
MQGDSALAKTTRMNMLFDFYGPLLTDKQQTFLKFYYHDDYSLGEIAADFEISRQAVYEHLKRAEQALEGYEDKLGLMARHIRLHGWLDTLDRQIDGLPQPHREALARTAANLRGSEEGEL